MKKALALTLAILMVIGMFAGCKPADPASTTAPQSTDPSNPDKDEIKVEKFEGDYVYKDAVVNLSTNWNPHTYQSADQSYPLDNITSGLYTFVYNDALHPVEGKEDFKGYAIMPELAASMPVDVTEKVRAEHPEFKIPEDAKVGFAYTIDLNPNAKFDNGKQINAKTYVESMKRLLDPKLMNYRAEDTFTGSLVIAGAEAYLKQGKDIYEAIGKPAADWLKEGGKADNLYVDMQGFFGVSAPDGGRYALISDDTMVRDPATPEDKPEAYVSGKYLYDNYLGPNGVYAALAGDYLFTVTGSFPKDAKFESVGLYESGEYQLTLVLENSLTGFYLYYGIGILSLPLVDVELYDKCLKNTDGVYTSTYCTSVDTTVGYGPYKLVDYQVDKSMRFERNENWFGYTDGKHVYQDPTDHKYYPMYQTTAIDTQVVAEVSTQKMMFMAGQLMGYGLQPEDFETYRNSEFVYATPATTIFFMILNGHKDAIATRESAKNFDKKTTDLETMTLDSFRRAMAITYDKELLASTISPSRSGAYGVIGNLYVYDVDAGSRYRDTEQAKKILCDVYSVDVSKFPTLDDAVKSITGYDPVKAKELYQQAFKEALEKGYITDTDKNGISDQTVTLTYALSQDSDFQTRMIDYLNKKVNEVTKGTGFEDKVKFVKSGPLGDGWADAIKQGTADTVLGGWQGSALDPFGLTDLYTNPKKAYDAQWFDATKIDLKLNVNVGGVDKKEMKEVTMTLKQWSDALNGAPTEVNGVTYNFGDGQTDVDTRLDILAGIEGAVLRTYNYLPMLQDASMALLSQQVYYVVDEYNPVTGRGGIAYMKYNYNETEWKAYVEKEGGKLQY